MTIFAAWNPKIYMMYDLLLQVLRAYAFNKAWVMGFLMDLFGAFLMLLALSQAPVYDHLQPYSFFLLFEWFSS